MRKLSILFLLLPAILFSEPSQKELKKINYLLNIIEKSKYTFIRNGENFSGVEAADHLRTKLDYAYNEIETAKEFIEHLATKSSMSGEYYLVVINKKKHRLGKWLTGKLKNYKSNP